MSKVTTLSFPCHPFKKLLQTTELANKPKCHFDGIQKRKYR